MLVKIAAAAAWASLALIAYATLSPMGLRPIVASQGFEHFAAYAALGLLFSWVYPRSTFTVCGIVLASAIVLELLQLVTPDRHARVLDAAIKIAGGLTGVAIAQLAIRFSALGRR